MSKSNDNLDNQLKKLAPGRIEEARKFLAKTVCGLEQQIRNVKWACEPMHWNEEVAFVMEEGALKLAYALAALDTWFDDEEEEK